MARFASFLLLLAAFFSAATPAAAQQVPAPAGWRAAPELPFRGSAPSASGRRPGWLLPAVGAGIGAGAGALLLTVAGEQGDGTFLRYGEAVSVGAAVGGLAGLVVEGVARLF